MTIERGVLLVKSSGKTKPTRIQVRIGDKHFTPAQNEVSQSVLDRLQELDGKEVEFERVKGQPTQVREVGGTFLPPRSVERSGGRESRGGPSPRGHRNVQSSQPASGRGQPQSSRQESRHTRNERSPSQRKGDFHNPYNFVPAPPRKKDDPHFGDHRPIAQDRFDADRYTGRIRVRMTAKTPLLVPDTENAEKNAQGHKTYPLRRDASGRPLIPASSVRGMLRSAYEAVTNSRFGRFSLQHRDRLAFRMKPGDGLKLIPARVHDGKIWLLTGTSRVASDGRPEPNHMYAAWLRRYERDGRIARTACRYHPDKELPQHGDEVECWLQLVQHHGRGRTDNQRVPDFQYWSVRSIVRAGEELGPAPESVAQQQHQSLHEPLGLTTKVRGWVCITNANIKRKHDERVFFADSQVSPPGPFALTEDHRSRWRELIQDYQAIHKEALERRQADGRRPDEYLGSDPGKTAWSRHVYTKEDLELHDGTLCYVRLSASQQDIDALFPVMISRELYPASPWDLLHESLRPATSIDELSPADRVFGWVRDALSKPEPSKQTPVAARGLLRVGPVHCESSPADSVERFSPPGIPLAILSTPKPQQGRFYVARTPQGEAQPDRQSKAEAGYSHGKGLRGRKVYPHQRSLPHDHWNHPEKGSTQRPSGAPPHYQEYHRPGGERDEQNRSILGWVKPGAVFTFELHVHNLATVELGALLWLLSLGDDCFFRFGGGKPLGFGSVRLAIDECDIRTGNELRSRYDSWQTDGPPADPRDTTIHAFQEALSQAYAPAREADGFDSIPFIKAFMVACKGFRDNLPIHYPRATQNGRPGPPTPEGQSFQWFVANEKASTRHALRDLYDDSDNGLPILEAKPSVKGGSRQ